MLNSEFGVVRTKKQNYTADLPSTIDFGHWRWAGLRRECFGAPEKTG